MDKEILWKNELIKSMQKENADLKDQLYNLQKDITRLEMRIAGLQSAIAIGRRGLPWN